MILIYIAFTSIYICVFGMYESSCRKYILLKIRGIQNAEHATCE